MALKLDPEFVMAYRVRGDSYSELGEYPRAVADFSEADRLKDG